MRMKWSGRRPKKRRSTAGMRVKMKWNQSRSAVGRIAELRKPYQEFSKLEGCYPHIPLGQVRGMCRAAKEVSHSVVCGVAGQVGSSGPA